MRSFSFFALVFVILCGSAKEGRAARYSGDYLLQMCAVNKEGQELVKGGKIACQAYISGILDYHALLKSLDVEPPGIDFCVPEDVGLNLLQLRLMNYLIKNREAQGPYIASPNVSLALREMYPCK